MFKYLLIISYFQVDIDALGGKLKTIYNKESAADPLEELEKKYANF